MLISDIDSLSNMTLSVDTYDMTTHTTTTHDLGDISAIMQDLITLRYNHRYFYYMGSQPNTTPKTAFLGLWASYKIYKQESINRVYQALVMSKYDPTENVFEYNKLTDTWGKVKTSSDIGEIENEHGAITTETTQGKKSGTSFINAKSSTTMSSTTMDNTNTFLPSNKTETENEPITSATNTQTYTDKTKQVENGEVTTEHIGNDTHTTERHGNVGTVESATMIKKELELRKMSFYDWLCADFINTYTYYTNLED